MMKLRKTLSVFTAFLALLSVNAQAADYLASTVGVGGYDLVSYHNAKRPVRGNGHYVTYRDGVTYLFATEGNKAEFDADPERFLPAYGGYCAFGVSVSKKFYGDPEVYRLVDGRLYLNLDARVQDVWLQDVSGNVATADRNWAAIKNKSPAEL